MCLGVQKYFWHFSTLNYSMHIIFYSPRVWDSTWGQEKNLVEELSKHYQIDIIDLIDYGLRYASKLRGQQYDVPKGVKILKRQTKLPAGVLLGIYTELKNLWDFVMVEWGSLFVRSDILITYLTSGIILTVLLAKCLGKNILLIYADDYAELFRNKSSSVAWFTEHIGTPVVTRLSDYVVATAHKLKEDIIQYNSRITVIPNGVHVRKLQEYHSKTHDSSRDSNPFTVGYTGGFGGWVDFEIVLKAAESLPDVQFKLIGSGDQFDEVASKAQSLNNVWVPGILHYDKMLAELVTMDVCLIPFKINRITDRVSPIKLFDYWAMRKPVISTRFYEIQKIANGKVLFVNDANDLKETIRQLKEQPDLMEQLAQIGFEEVQNYDWAKLGKRYLEILSNL